MTLGYSDFPVRLAVERYSRLIQRLPKKLQSDRWLITIEDEAKTARSGLCGPCLTAIAYRRGNGAASNIWMTYRQAQELKAQVRKGEHGSLVVFADRFKKTETTTKARTWGKRYRL